MRHTAANVFLLILTGAFAAPTWSQQTAHITPAKTTTSKPAVKVTPSAQLIFGSIGIASKSVAAKQQLEIALDSYETAQYAEAVKHAQIAAEKDPQSALAYAVWSYAARWIGSAPDALAKAQALSAKSALDEKLLVTFMVGTQQADSLPAIIAMNDLVQKHPKDKHVLYLAGDWLFSQEDSTRGRKLLEKSLEQDPNFPPALNSLGYAYVGSLEPAKGISLLRKYADELPDDPNAQDSLGEVLRMTGDDEGFLARYAAALEISSTFITSAIWTRRHLSRSWENIRKPAPNTTKPSRWPPTNMTSCTSNFKKPWSFSGKGISAQAAPSWLRFPQKPQKPTT